MPMMATLAIHPSWREEPRGHACSFCGHAFPLCLFHARTVRRLQVSGTGWIPPSPFVQFKLYQGEVFQYKPGASDPDPTTQINGLICTRNWVESTQAETPESALQSERCLCNFHFNLLSHLEMTCKKEKKKRSSLPSAFGWVDG